MIWRHLATVVWLRERLRRNQARKSPVAALIARILHIATLAAGVVMFLVFFAVGAFMLGRASPTALLLVWDGFVAAFLFFWLTGLLTQLQRSELLSAERFLPFPVPPRTVFVINYLGSGVLTADVIVIGSGMLGLAVGLTVSRGIGMLLLVPLVLAFLLLVTAASHQFQGWLAALMTNRQRRRHVIAAATFGFVVVLVALSQAGPIASRLVARSAGVPSGEVVELRRERQALERARRTGTIDQDEYAARSEVIRRRLDPLNAAIEAERRRLIEEVVVPAHRWVPPAWLPYGAMALHEGRLAPPLLGGLGLVLLGLASLARSYRTTLRLYLGETGGAVPRAAAPVRPPRETARAGSGFLEWRLPWLSEQATAIVLASFRSLTRAPEARMMILTPIIMAVIFGGMLFRPGGGGFLGLEGGPSVFMRPLMAIGLFLLILLGMNQIAANQFGFDRDGFRVFVLGSASRKDVLLGKNLALMPLALGLGVLALIVLQLFAPMRADHFAATLAQTVSIYLLYCLVANLLSIVAPMPIKAGSLKPARTNATLILVNMAALFVFPLALAPALIPLGVEVALDTWAGLTGAPIYLVLSAAQVAGIALFYVRALTWEGRLLQAREQQILEAVTGSAE